MKDILNVKDLISFKFCAGKTQYRLISKVNGRYVVLDVETMVATMTADSLAEIYEKYRHYDEFELHTWWDMRSHYKVDI